MRRIIVLVSLFVSCFSAAIKIDDQNEEKYRIALENNDLFGGDILTPKKNRFATNNVFNLWPKNTIPYVIAENRTNLLYEIEKAMRHIESKTCIKFVERTIERNYIYIFKGNGCYSHVGRIGGMQTLSLGYGCEPFGTIVHELMHAIGFYHHHQRFDRDQYLDIHWGNIKSGKESNFVKLSAFRSLIFTQFDFMSIMLYDELSFSKNGISKTMTAKDQNISLLPVWKKMYLSDKDAFSINKLYNCY